MDKPEEGILISSVERLNVEPGDVIVFRFERPVTPEFISATRDNVVDQLALANIDARVLVLDKGLSIDCVLHQV